MKIISDEEFEAMSGNEYPTVDSYATVVDDLGRFVESIGRVIEAGELIVVHDSNNTECYKKDVLLESVKEAGLGLVFLPPGVRLPKAPTLELDRLYKRMATAKVAKTR